MKKFTLLAIAALLSVVAFAQKSGKQACQMAPQTSRMALQNASRAQRVPAWMASQTTVQQVASRRALRRAFTSADDLVGKMMMLNTLQTYSQEEGLQLASPSAEGYSVEIVKQDDGTLAIANFVNGSDELITIDVDFANGTFTIPAGQVAYNHSQAGECILANMQSDGDLTGTIYDEALVINEIYAVVVAEGQYKDYMLTDYLSSVITPSNGTMAWTDSDGEEQEIDVYMLQDEDTHTVSVYNFADWGTAIDIQLKDEQTFVIEPQLVTSSSNGDYYTCSAIAGTNYIGGDQILGTGTETTLTSSSNFTAVNDQNSWFGNYGAFTITASGFEFVYPVIEDVAAVPANPEVVTLSEYNAEKGYGACVLNIPVVDVDGNALKESKLYYQLYSDISGTVAPITFTPELYENVEEAMTEVPFTFVDDYDFDVSNGYKRVFLNYDYSDYTRIGVKSIYKGGNTVNETEIQWLDIAALRELQAAYAALEAEITAATAKEQLPGWMADAVYAAIAAYNAEDATVESLQDALEALAENVAAFQAIESDYLALVSEIAAAQSLVEDNTEWTNDVDKIDAAIAAADEAAESAEATNESLQAALAALKKAEDAFQLANMTLEEYLNREVNWVARTVYADVTSGSQAVDAFDVDKNIAGLFSKGEGTTAPQYYANGTSVRFYKNNTVTFFAGEDVEKITKIQIAFTTASYAKETSASVDGYTQTGNVGVWEGETKEITFTNSMTASSGHSRIVGFTVSYKLKDTVVGISNVQTVSIPVGAVYNMQGQRLSEKPQKGLYIMNGKKYMAK